MGKLLEERIDYDFYAELSVDQGKRYIAELKKQIADEQALLLLRCVTMPLYASELERIKQSRPKYLTLPGPVRAIEQEKEYVHWCAVGRLWYRLAQFEMNEETYEMQRVTVRYDRAELFEQVSEIISLSDPLLAAKTPLVCRVGYCVGWLSGLAISRSDDAQAVLVMLAALVAPLLVGLSASASTATSTKQLRHPASKRTSLKRK